VGLDASLASPRNQRDLGVVTEDEMTLTIKDLEAFADGWKRHDLDLLMTFMAEDCVFETSTGPEAAGKRYVGREQVREGFAGVFRRFPDVHFSDARHFVSGDRGLSEWLLTATTADGRKIEVTGCDVFTFRGDKITVKNSYLKNRTG
jgi:ketosteroid isomerase-like protein